MPWKGPISWQPAAFAQPDSHSPADQTSSLTAFTIARFHWPTKGSVVSNSTLA
jgi:hypothetical protein